MQATSSRATGADRPPSTPGVSSRHASRWPFRVGMVAIAGLAIAAPVMAAEPASAPRTPEPVVRDASPARAVKDAPDDPFQTVGFAALLSAAGSSGKVVAVPPAPTTTTTAPPSTTAAPEPVVEPIPVPAPAPAPAPAPVAPAAPAVANGSDWDRLAQCEAGGNWAINTGNGYYGGLQFSLSSWQGVGGTGLPSDASRETQIAMGERLKASGGWGHWPACSRKLGLR